MTASEGPFLPARGARVKVGRTSGFPFRTRGVADLSSSAPSRGSMERDLRRTGPIWVKLFRGKEGRYGAPQPSNRAKTRQTCRLSAVLSVCMASRYRSRAGPHTTTTTLLFTNGTLTSVCMAASLADGWMLSSGLVFFRPQRSG